MFAQSTPLQLSRIIGFSILLMALSAGVIMGGVFAPLFELENPNEFLILNSRSYEWGIAGWWLIFILDVIVSIGVFRLYGGNQNRLAQWASVFRILYSIILAMSITYLMKIPLGDEINSISNLTVKENLESFQKIWSLGLILFGIHLILLSAVVDRGGWIKNIIAFLLLIGGVGYVIIHSLDNFNPEFLELNRWIEHSFIAPMILGELGWAIELVVKRRKVNA